MTFKPRFFYNTDAPQGGGGGDDTAIDNKVDIKVEDRKDDNIDTKVDDLKVDTKQDNPLKEIHKEVISDEELKSFGFNSKEELRNFLAKSKNDNLSEEEKKERDNIEKATFLKFSAENKLLNVEDFNKFETLKATADRDLVYEKHLAEFKADHPEITDEKELQEAAQEDFALEYKLNSESEAQKKKGEAKLAKEANEIRSPFESKVTKAQGEFKQNNSIRETYPKFEKFVDESILKNTPDKTVLYKAKDGEKEIDIEIELTKADREAIAKDFKTPKTFALFTSAKTEDIQAAIDKKMQGWIRLNKFDEVNAKTFEIAHGIGLAKGSTAGAENSFALNGGATAKNTTEKTVEQSNLEIAQSRQKYNFTR